MVVTAGGVVSGSADVDGVFGSTALPFLAGICEETKCSWRRTKKKEHEKTRLEQSRLQLRNYEHSNNYSYDVEKMVRWKGKKL